MLHRLLRASGERIADERRREQLPADTFEPLMRIDGRRTATDPPAIRPLSGFERINQAITEAMTDASGELLAIQPHRGGDRALRTAEALHRDQALLAATPGSDSRAQLGYLIGQSGILDQEPHAPRGH